MPKKTEINDIHRLEKLTTAIEKHYEKEPLDFVERLAASYEITITEMFELTSSNKKGWQITHLFDDTVFEPVHFPKTFAKTLCRGDVFLLTMGLREGKWVVIFMSPPYETVDMDEEFEEERPVLDS